MKCWWCFNELDDGRRRNADDAEALGRCCGEAEDEDEDEEVIGFKSRIRLAIRGNINLWTSCCLCAKCWDLQYKKKALVRRGVR